jgi:hypothetical protein
LPGEMRVFEWAVIRWVFGRVVMKDFEGAELCAYVYITVCELFDDLDQPTPQALLFRTVVNKKLIERCFTFFRPLIGISFLARNLT